MGRFRLKIPAWVAVAVLALLIIASTASALFTDGSFESGSLQWSQVPFVNTGLTGPAGKTFTFDDINLIPGGYGQTIITPPSEFLVPDPLLGWEADFRYPKFGQRCARFNGPDAARLMEWLSQQTVVTAADIDPVDGLAHVRFAFAPILGDAPGESQLQRPWICFWIRNISKTGAPTVYTRFVFADEGVVPWKVSNGVKYTDWSIIDIPLKPSEVAIGHTLDVNVLPAGCSLYDHVGYVYLDGFGSKLPGLWVSKLANLDPVENGTNLTYTLTYHNDGPTAVNNVVIHDAIPSCASFASATNPTTGGTTSFSSGVVTSSVGTLAAGAKGSFTVTVVASSDAVACPEIVSGDYTIDSNGVMPLHGQPITTRVYDHCAPGTLVINTGWDAVQGAEMGTGEVDNEWVVVTDPVGGTAEPRPTYVLSSSAYDARRVSAYGPGVIKDKDHVIFEYRFCLDNILAFLDAYVSVNVYPRSVYLNGHLLTPGMNQDHYTTGPFDFGLFNVGENVLRVDVNNNNGIYGNPNVTLYVTGTIFGGGAHYRSCCTAASGVVTGLVFLDSNTNGKQDGTEHGTNGWVVELWQGTSLLQTKITDYFGNYYFMDVAPGTYRVEVNPHTGAAFTTVDSQTRLVTRGASVTHVDFGFKKVVDSFDPRKPAIVPNPFNPTTTISFNLSERGPVSLKIYGVSGDLVRTIIDGELAPGAQQRVWDGRDNSGRPAASGVYFGKLVTKTGSQTVKMVLLK
jgi:uncharacterized repeat protein (TIGR01451 family)